MRPQVAPEMHQCAFFCIFCMVKTRPTLSVRDNLTRASSSGRPTVTSQLEVWAFLVADRSARPERARRRRGDARLFAAALQRLWPVASRLACARHQLPVDDRVRLAPAFEARASDRRVDGVRGGLVQSRALWYLHVVTDSAPAATCTQIRRLENGRVSSPRPIRAWLWLLQFGWKTRHNSGQQLSYPS